MWIWTSHSCSNWQRPGMSPNLHTWEMCWGGDPGKSAFILGIATTSRIHLFQLRWGVGDPLSSFTAVMKAAILAIMASASHTFPLNFENNSERWWLFCLSVQMWKLRFREFKELKIIQLVSGNMWTHAGSIWLQNLDFHKPHPITNYFLKFEFFFIYITCVYWISFQFCLCHKRCFCIWIFYLLWRLYHSETILWGHMGGSLHQRQLLEPS